jgi:hypothetical protein
VLGIAEKEVTARLQVTRHLAKKDILRFLIEVNERIAKEDNVEAVIERPSGVHEIDAFELNKPGNIWLDFHASVHVVRAAKEVFPLQRCVDSGQ